VCVVVVFVVVVGVACCCWFGVLVGQVGVVGLVGP